MENGETDRWPDNPKTSHSLPTIVGLDVISTLQLALSVGRQMVVVRRSSSVLVSINEVDLRLSWLVLGWVTVSGFSSRCRTFILERNQEPMLTQPGHPFEGRCNEYQPKGDDALRLGRKGRYGSCVGGR